MISYLKIELFAYDLFHTVWFKGGLISRKYDATQIYKDECLSDNDYKEVCDRAFYNAILCRRILFQRIYTEEITKEKDRYWNSVSDFYEYIRCTCNRYDWFGYVTVFERLLATCAFVLNLCFYNRENENVDIIKFGHICWATYFDTFTEKFYEQGGWNQLKNVANSYTLPLKFLQMCLNEPENAFAQVAEAIENYNNSKQTSILHECETVSNLWIKSCIENLQRPSNNRAEFVIYEKFIPTEHVLNELKRLCSPALEVLQYDEECSERSVFGSDSFYISLTPITSEESMNGESVFSFSSDGIEDALPETSSVEIFEECEIDDRDFKNQLCLNEFKDITSNNYCDDISNSSLDIFKQPIEFESICFIPDWEKDQYPSKPMNKMNLNHDTLELEETAISETDYSSNTNDDHLEDQILNLTNEILVLQEMIDRQYQILEDSHDAIELVPYDASVKVFSTTKGKPSQNQCFKEFSSHVTTFPNNVLSYDNRISLSISEWDERDLMKNISTPIKTKTDLTNENKTFR